MNYSAGCIASPAHGERGSGNSRRSAVLLWNVIAQQRHQPSRCERVCSCTCTLNSIITFLWIPTSMSCDHCNPIGSADIPAGDMAERPEFPDPLSPRTGDAIHPALWKQEGVVHETRAGGCACTLTRRGHTNFCMCEYCIGILECTLSTQNFWKCMHLLHEEDWAYADITVLYLLRGGGRFFACSILFKWKMYPSSILNNYTVLLYSRNFCMVRISCVDQLP